MFLLILNIKALDFQWLLWVTILSIIVNRQVTIYPCVKAINIIAILHIKVDPDQL